MWNIFISKHQDTEELLTAIRDWGDSVYAKMDVKIKQYFAENVVIHFDYTMLFNHKKKVIEHLQESLSQGLANLSTYEQLFQEIKSYLVKQDDDYFLIVEGLPQDSHYYPLDYGFKLLEENAQPQSQNFKKFEKLSFANLVYHVSLSDVEKGWINYTPDLKKRSLLQAQHIMMHLHEKEINEAKIDENLSDKINYEKNLANHPQFKTLSSKLEKILPKIEASMDFSWRQIVLKNNSPQKNNHFSQVVAQ